MVFASEWHVGQVALSMLYFFLFFIVIWLMIMVFSDIFRDHKMSGWAKALWVLFLLVAPMLGVFVYLIFRGQGMGRRSAASAREAQDRFDTYVRDAAGSGQSPTQQIAHAKSLLDSGAIDQGEYDRLKTKALA